MSERYSEQAIYRQVHNVPVLERRKMVEEILATIDPDNIKTHLGSTMFFPFKVGGLVLIGRAWRLSSEVRDTFLDDDKSDERLIKGVNHWWPHAPKIPRHWRIFDKPYERFMNKRNEDPLIKGKISTAIIIACMRKEGTIS